MPARSIEQQRGDWHRRTRPEVARQEFADVSRQHAGDCSIETELQSSPVFSKSTNTASQAPCAMYRGGRSIDPGRRHASVAQRWREERVGG